ncbi:N-acetylmuramoyl-L-alanine amidase [Lysobacteraceae bacterium NML91-0213]|nr:N-acetylmuramoyl-L-alanine amidase [Xanthomonadaceae bacterium NML91-0213]
MHEPFSRPPEKGGPGGGPGDTPAVRPDPFSRTPEKAVQQRSRDARRRSGQHPSPACGRRWREAPDGARLAAGTCLRYTGAPPLPGLHRTVIRTLLLASCIAFLAACSHAPPRNPMAQWVESPNHDARRPTLIVVHYTEQDSAAQSLHTLRTGNRFGPVSAHYLIGADGTLYQLVADERRAWHAGAGSWGTISDVNSASIGIELDNDGQSPFADAQIDALIALLDDLTTRLRIPRTHVIGHSDLAPGRKVDPGPLFPWQRLAEAGFGVWPDADAPPAPEGFDPLLALRLLGYPLDNPAATIRSYRMRFRGDAADTLDAEDLRILHALTRHEPVPAR